MAEKAELIITALQERVGQLVANYETQIAILRAELTQYINQEKQKQQAEEEYSEKINEIIGE